MDPQLSSLDYAPVAPARQTWKYVRRALRWLGLLALVVIAAVYVPQIIMQLYFLRSQQQCLTYSLPASTLVYTNDSQEAQPLLQNGYMPVACVVGQAFIPGVLATSQSGPVSAGFVLPPLDSVDEGFVSSYGAFAGTLHKFEILHAPPRTGAFLHRLSNRTIGDRLVAVLFMERQQPPSYPPTDTQRHLEIDALVWRTAGWRPGSTLTPIGLTTLPFAVLDKQKIRIFAGQLDPKDASHFMLAYQIDGKGGIIEGWLGSSEKVQLQIRDGPARVGPNALGAAANVR